MMNNFKTKHKKQEDYMKNENMEQNFDRPETQSNDAPQENVILTPGFIKNCVVLTIRESDNKDAKAIEVIKVGEQFMVDEKQSKDDFYKVVTEKGVSGFCMKAYVNLRPNK